MEAEHHWALGAVTGGETAVGVAQRLPLEGCGCHSYWAGLRSRSSCGSETVVGAWHKPALPPGRGPARYTFWSAVHGKMIILNHGHQMGPVATALGIRGLASGKNRVRLCRFVWRIMIPIQPVHN
jgi:hypothetical protein